MKRVGLVGWRGMVGSVLIDRMRVEHDFELDFEPVFFTTSQIGAPGPDVGHGSLPLEDAKAIDRLRTLDIVITCQGSDYTSQMHAQLRAAGWQGYWIDSASALRMRDDTVIVLDPVNRSVIDKALRAGIKDYAGGNCTVSVMLMALHGLIGRNWVEWVSSMTYQAASGAGAKHMRELVAQMRAVGQAAAPLLDAQAVNALELDRQVMRTLAAPDYPVQEFGAPLAASLIAWIDKPVDHGQTREEWKGHAEANKILALQPPLAIDGICVRVGAMRSHCLGLTIKLTRDIPLSEIEATIVDSNPWTKLIANVPAETRRHLSPAAVSGTLDIAVGRLHKMKMGAEYLCAFTVGDQLLWGAAEPLRRMLRILLGAL